MFEDFHSLGSISDTDSPDDYDLLPRSIFKEAARDHDHIFDAAEVGSPYQIEVVDPVWGVFTIRARKPVNRQDFTIKDIPRLSGKVQLNILYNIYVSDWRRRNQRYGWQNEDIRKLMEQVIVKKKGGRWRDIKVKFSQKFNHVEIREKWKNIMRQLKIFGIDDIWCSKGRV
jgi:hypothetical protein